MKNLSVLLATFVCLASFAADPVVPMPVPPPVVPPVTPAPVTPPPVTPTPVRPPAPPIVPPVTVRPVTPEVITGELVADKVVLVPMLGRVQIMAPRFVFSKDFGYGTEILPDLRVGRDTTTISHWVCAQFGYGKAVNTFGGTRAVVSKVVMEARGLGLSPRGNDLVLANASYRTTAMNLTCAELF